ncbi:MAG: squalene/phytoene synthase family protein [Silicimonas sp.]|nr:squalene/phytoene synthase family protein [Silicimonas sp.]
MTLQACADIVAKGDPDRFMAAMAAPVAARSVLFPLYAFNVEVARAPWVASEPMIGEMRLQWWRDVLEEISEGKNVRRHEVATPLSNVLDKGGAEALDKLVQRRRWDLYQEPFEDAEHFQSYLAAGGFLMWTAARLLGAELRAVPKVMAFGQASALARFLIAVPELEARGRIPLIDGRSEAVRNLAKEALVAMPGWGELKLVVPRGARPALLEGWQTLRLLEMVMADPTRVAEGRLGQSEFRKRASLFLKAL